jgi:glycerophosphoryl diester phosphodiesterase
MYPNLPRPTIFAHRGASAYAPENTLAAFELAVLQKADAIELDVKLSSDGQVVVIHDQTVDRTTDARGWVKDMPLAALKELDAGSHFDVAYKGETIPTLSQVLETVGRKIFINIELTNYSSPSDALPERVADLINHHGLANNILFSSFHPVVLRRINKLLPAVPIGYLAHHGFSGIVARGWFGKVIVNYQAFHPELRDASQELVYRMHQTGHRVHVYTVNQVKDMFRLFSYGVDGIFSDDPIRARETLVNSFGTAIRE